MRLKDVRDRLQEAIGSPVLRCENVDGSSTALCFRVLAEGHEPLFCKIDEGTSGSLLAEADGLYAIKATEAVRVPSVVTVDAQILIMEAIEHKLSGPDFGKNLAEALHRLHQVSGPLGWHRDNFIGRSPQRNIAAVGISWSVFFWENRLRVQFEALQNRDFFPIERAWLPKLKDLVLTRLDSVREPPSLLHGDLWSGNVLCDEEDEPVLIDPAVSFGHREADLAMMRIFGGFSREFYNRYEQLWPYEDGHEKRSGIYQLYHLLNHAQIFGESYWRQAWDLIENLLAEDMRVHPVQSLQSTRALRPQT